MKFNLLTVLALFLSVGLFSCQEEESGNEDFQPEIISVTYEWNCIVCDNQGNAGSTLRQTINLDNTSLEKIKNGEPYTLTLDFEYYSGNNLEYGGTQDTPKSWIVVSDNEIIIDHCIAFIGTDNVTHEYTLTIGGKESNKQSINAPNDCN
jgi:hypothetical protein